MRTFLALCILAIASADQPGYDYQPVGHSDEGLSFQPGGGEAVLSEPIQASAPAPAPVAPAPVVEEFEKEFYSYTAPDHEFEEHAPQVGGSNKNNVRVIFIRGPETNSLHHAALQMAQGGEERTAIYVLQKQPDVSGLVNQLQNVQRQPSRPEVHFVKYRTQQDAENAQQSIRSQYDSLPGSSTTHNGGQAPVLNFASQAPAQHQSHAAPAAPSSTYVPSNPSPQQNYLPPSLRRFVRY